ncbi:MULTISPECIES: hypothetical protein [Algibacter]|uniref:Knr4/Smi1-like domain-containing protein n=1 Tax=Algibacter lectus TaxID=221126 RepID=A0A4R8MCA7_9FLAO|nr:hypothetical protein [Algibacter lectus]MWW26883.1 hypothetical protein [Algibacter lectus]TDY63360.1 hypothetical protein DFQ06_0235 [Algibacter lectus]
MKYNFEKEFLEKVEDKTDSTNLREKISDIELINLKKEFPKISSEFLDYLSEIGSGNFRECQFKVQKYLFDLEDLGLEEHYELKDGIKFFGDNFSGDFSGFDFNGNPDLVVEFWHEDGTIYETNKTYKDYIREQMLIGDNGQDERE